MTAQSIEKIGGIPAWGGALVRATGAVALAILAVGAGLRIADFLGGRSLWLDEAMIALNLAHLPVDQLLGQLKFDQIAPLGWLLLEKGLLSAWSDFDYSLRIVSLLFGVASLGAFWALARRALDAQAALVALALFAISPPLIMYASMVKPYIVDVFFSVVLTAVALRLLDGEPRRGVWTLALGAIGLCAIPLSFPALLVLAPVGLVLFARGAVERDLRWLVGLAVVGAAWLALFAALQFGFYARQTTTISNMQNVFWGATFAPLPPRSLGEIAWYPRAIANGVGWLLEWPGTIVLGIVLLAGGLATARRRPWLFALCVGPVVTALLVSAARAYPFESRFILFLAPQFLLLLAAGIMTIARQCRPAWPLAAVLCLAVGAGAVVETARSALKTPPWPMEEIKPNLALLAERAAPGDTVFLSVAAERAYLLYAPRYGLAERDYLVGSNYQTSPSCAYADIETLRRREGPSWVLLYHLGPGSVEGSGLFVRMLGEVGDLKLIRRESGSWLYRFEPDRGSAVVLPEPDPACRADRQEQPFLEEVQAAIRNGAAARSVTPSGGTPASRPRS